MLRGALEIGLAAVCAAALVAGAAQAKGPESRYTKAGPKACREVESGEPEGQDWLLYRCAGQPGVPVWALYQDSTRMQLAFGPDNFDHYAPFSSDRDEGWSIEWRGVVDGGFRPYAAIARMRPVGETSTTLAVYRVWADKASCLIGEAADNAAARAMADAAATLAECPA